jgi:hypothetical protein
VRFALALINSGMADAAAENFLYDAVTAYAANIDPERLKRRLREIPDLVSSARKILDAEEKEEQGQPGAQQAPAQPQAPAAGQLPELGEWDIADAPPSRPRGWLLGHVFCRTYISELIGPGGVGKTATRAAQYLSLTSGRSLTGEKVWKRCRVLVISLEDNGAEANRRFTAAMIHHDVTKAEISGWLFVSAPGARVGKLLALDKKGRSFRDILADVIEDAIKRIKPGLVGLDPLVKAIGVSENDNTLVDMAIQILTDLADKYDVAIDLLHHVRKGAPDPGNADTARGASANVNAGRLVYTLTTMSSEEAERFGVAEDDRRAYVRMDSAKVNITRSAGQAKWFHLVSVQIGNRTDEYPDGDEVQTVEPWTPPAAFDGLDTGTCNRILDEIDAGLSDGERYSSAPRATTRAAWQAVERHAQGKPESQCREIIRQWLANGLLIVEIYHSKKDRKSVEGLRVDNAKRPGARTDT